MPEAPNCMPGHPTMPEASQLYINRSNDAHLYSLSLMQLEDAKKEIHKKLSYPIRHTFFKKKNLNKANFIGTSSYVVFLC